MGPSQVLFMDEITTGLDSSNAFVIVQCFRHLAHLQQATVLMALLQPAPEVFDLFDDVMLLAEGKLPPVPPPALIISACMWLAFGCRSGGSAPDSHTESGCSLHIMRSRDMHRSIDTHSQGKVSMYVGLMHHMICFCLPGI